MSSRRFRIAFSFAGEKRDYVAKVAKILAFRFGQDAILYDRYHQAEFSRSDLAFYLSDLYHHEADLVVAVLCPDYEQKEWCGLEWSAIFGILKERRVDEVMLASFGRARGRGLHDLGGYTELDNLTPEEAAGRILERLAINEGRPREYYQDRREVGGTDPPAATPNNLPRLQYFFGRQADLKKIADALAPEARGWGALIDGPGGIGKTSLVIRAAELVPAGRFRRIIFLSAKKRELAADGQRSLGSFVLPGYLDMLNAIARELDQRDVEKSPESERSDLVLRILRDSEVLLVLDNLESLPELDRDQLFAFLNHLPRGCNAIVTSRRRADASAVVVRLDKLEWPAARELITEISKHNDRLRRATDREQRALYEETGGNPLLIRWVAGQLGLGRCRDIAAALDFLRSAPAGNDPLEFIFGDLLDTFTANETRVLAALSHFTTAMDVGFIAELSDLSETAAQSALSDLSSRALAVPDLEERRFVLVPMVADFLRRKRPEVVAETGGRLEEHAYKVIVENGHYQPDRFPVLESAWPALASALPLFLAGPESRIHAVSEALNSFLDFTGRWDERLSLSQQAEARAVAAGNHAAAGRDAFRAGWIHYRREQADAVLACADRAAAHWQRADASPRERASAVRLRGIGRQLAADYPAAIAAFQEVLEVVRARSAESEDVANILTDIAYATWCLGDLPAAEGYLREALRVATAVDHAEGVATTTGNLAELAWDRSDLPESESLARDALALAEQLGRQELIASNCARLAGALVGQGKTAEALPHAQRAVALFTRLGLAADLERARATMLECGPVTLP